MLKIQYLDISQHRLLTKVNRQSQVNSLLVMSKVMTYVICEVT